MKIGILSDSHDNMPALIKAVSVFNDADVKLVIHAGDLVAPFVSKPLNNLKMDFLAVFGNNDGERFGLSEAFKGKIHRPPYRIEFGGKKICVLHEPDNLDALDASGCFDMIVYGHTHDVEVKKARTLIVNPGECGGWLRGRRTVALWDLDKNDVDILNV